MSAENYLPDEDPEDSDAGWYPRSPHGVTCKRCGTHNLYWKQGERGWRLYTYGGTPHLCSSCNMITASPKADLTKVMQPTLATFAPKESIMDKNAVAFIRNDVRTLTVAFIDSEKGSSEDYTAEGLRQRALPYQKYTYLTIDKNIQSGDWALVSVKGIIKAVYVVSVADELNIEPNAPVTYSFIVGRVDLAPYQSLIEQNDKIADMLRTSYQASIREGFRQTLLNGLPEDQRNSISLLLNKD